MWIEYSSSRTWDYSSHSKEEIFYKFNILELDATPFLPSPTPVMTFKAISCDFICNFYS